MNGESVKSALVMNKAGKSTLGGGINVGVLFILFLFIVLGISLLPTVISQSDTSTGTPLENASSTVKVLMALVPVFYVFILIGAPVYVVNKMFKNMG